MEREWKQRLGRDHGARFDRLITITNMPIARFLDWLESSGNLQRYMELLVQSFNPATLAGLMCRSTLSVSWDGRIFDCDFNQMLELEAIGVDGAPMSVRSFDPTRLRARRIVTGRHCFGCTAGSGSSCSGALDGS
jgi:radical SAM/Cys-rich protein